MIDQPRGRLRELSDEQSPILGTEPELLVSYGLEILKRTHFPVSPCGEASDRGEL